MSTPPGAWPDEAGTTFAAWSTTAHAIAVRLFEVDADPATRGAASVTPVRTEALAALGDGRFEAHVPGVGSRALYMFVIDGVETPDPYARFLPFGVHGPARVVAPVEARVRALVAAAPLSQSVLYELHVGTFSPQGTYRGAMEKLDALVELGVTAIELLPLASFAGARGWGYDGVALYAPHAGYGEPDDLRALVDAAHERGIAVLLDVVYNHLGPSGNYLQRYAPEYFTSAVQPPWGSAPDFGYAPMRRLVLDNARYWLEDFGFDGLRLDATHAIRDRSGKHVLRELTELAHAMVPARRIFFEDERNDPETVTVLGADGVWADDFHHQVHVLLTGERDGYYGSYEPTVASLARAINEGWSFTGQAFAFWEGRARGRSARDSGLLPEQLVYCLQNHDQVGNRALGERLTALADVDAFCAASLLLLSLPATPLVFMGQEWAATSPFLFFSDHEEALGEAVRQGRREELESFAAFVDAGARSAIPDPQARSTFERSKLEWDQRVTGEIHRRVLSLYRAMIALRRTDAVLGGASRWQDFEATAEGDLLVVIRRRGEAERRAVVSFAQVEREISVGEGWRVLLATGSVGGGRLGPHSAVLTAKG